MPTLRKPTSNSGCIILLDNILITGPQDILAGNLYVQQATLTEIGLFLPGFKTAESTVKEKLENKMKEVREKGESLEVLEGYCRDTWENVRRTKKRLNQPSEIFAYYGLSADGISPHPDSTSAWLKIAQDIIDGGARAVLDGYPTILSPSVAEIQIVLNKAQDEYNDYAMADREHDQAQAAIAALRPQADEFINEVYDQLAFALRKMDNASQRRVMRTYGYRYDYSPGEPPEEVPAKPGNFVAQYNDPNLTLFCDAVATATGYQMIYTIDEVNWVELYVGADPTFTYDPPVGRRVYKVRAENEFGYGEWSDPVEYEVTEVTE